jgi:hypothetical protein
LGERAEAVEEAAAARRSKVVPIPAGPVEAPQPARAPKPETKAQEPSPASAAVPYVESPARPRMKPRGPRVNQAERRTIGVRWVEEPQSFSSDPSFAEIFVNIGRRDGVAASDFHRVLGELGRISDAEIGPIRIRDRSSFVSIKRETLEKALAVLNGAVVAGKVAQAEPARARSSGTSSTNDG